jgi:hypothetical protein
LTALGFGLALSLFEFTPITSGFSILRLSVPASGLVLEVKPGAGIGSIARELQQQPGLLRSYLLSGSLRPVERCGDPPASR